MYKINKINQCIEMYTRYNLRGEEWISKDAKELKEQGYLIRIYSQLVNGKRYYDL